MFKKKLEGMLSVKRKQDEISDDIIAKISKIDSVSRTIIAESLDSTFIFPAKHFITNKEQQTKAFKIINQKITKKILDMISEISKWEFVDED